MPVSDSSHGKQSTEEAGAKTTSTSHVKGTVLIVDDETLIREVAHAMLKDIGFEIIEAIDGKEAVECYRQHQSEISAVLLDMTMPQMDGKTCFAELKKINPDVRVLLSSGYSEQDINKLFADHTPAGFIQKPYMPESLQQKMEEILQ
ncbi:MAG: response regulator [Mariprofundaceae bacterium]